MACRRRAFLTLAGLALLAAAGAPLHLLAAGAPATTAPTAVSGDNRCAVELLVLGSAQDAGAPQIGNPGDPAWRDPGLRRLAASLALIDWRSGERFLFEATPDIGEQLHRLDRAAPSRHAGLGIDGIFLTHAHIGHYAGLMFLGHEAAGASDIPVYAMPRMRAFLMENGPWDQLVRYRNIALRPLESGEPTDIGDALTVTPYPVPHRDEYSETVAFLIRSADRAALFLPDIDSWDEWESEYGIRIEDMVRQVDIAFLDATFFDDDELPGRDMSAISHPRIAGSMRRFARLGERENAKIRFIHLNHTNPTRYPDSPEARQVDRSGFAVAREGDTFCLATED